MIYCFEFGDSTLCNIEHLSAHVTDNQICLKFTLSLFRTPFENLQRAYIQQSR